MKITRLCAENVKRLLAVEIDADGKPAVVVGGNNEQGKTSVLDSIMYAIGGGRTIPARSVHDGADDAVVELVLDNGLKVRRAWKADGTSKIAVTSPDGARYLHPQSILDTMLGDLSFDPLAFDRMKPEEQVAALARIAAVTMPVPGMAMTDGGVTIGGIPWEQCSSAQRLEASVAMGFAANPKLRVILVRDGSLLDRPHLARIVELAEKHDGQVWVERVGDGDECSVVIEDGRIRGAKKAKQAGLGL